MVATIEPHAGRTADAVQAEVEAWIDEHWDPALTVREWWSKLATAGLSYSMLAPPYGRGYSREQNAAVFAALRAKGAMGPPAAHHRRHPRLVPAVLRARRRLRPGRAADPRRARR